MKLTLRCLSVPARFGLVALPVLIMALAGCRRDEVKVQFVPKESPAPSVPSAEPTAAAPADFHPAPAASRPQFKWTLPEGWQEKAPSQMRVASFLAQGSDGQTADVSVIPLPTGGREVDLVNMWRQEMQLPIVTGDLADKQSEPVAVGADSGRLFDIASEQPVLEGNQRGRLLVAMVTRGTTSWFFKMRGSDAFVGSQKPVFVAFLKSVSFESAATAPAVVEMPATGDAHAFAHGAPVVPELPAEKPGAPPALTLPPDWVEVPPTQFLLAKFVVTGAGGGKAEISVSTLSGTGGGLLANVNRWRNQLALPPLAEGDLARQTSTMDTVRGPATLSELSGIDPASGAKTRLVGVVLPQTDETWFYKMKGDEAVVEQQKESFAKFVRAAPFSHAP